MDRCAVFVDAGYLFAAGGELCCGTKARNRIQLNAAEANGLLTELARTRCQLPVLRTYWSLLRCGSDSGPPALSAGRA